MIHIWLEDSQNSAATQFWRFLAEKDVAESLHNAEITGFGGNNQLYACLSTAEFNSQDTYYIFMDKVLDNPKALKYYLNANMITSQYENVVLADLLSFEYLLLKFKHFVKWTKPVKQNLLYEKCEPVREELIYSIETGVSWIRQERIVDFIIKQKRIDTHTIGWQKELSFISSENIATFILSCMTNGGTIEFGISKTSLGKCWCKDCCFKYHEDHAGITKCRIYENKNTSEIKALCLWNETDARKIIEQ